ncbi:MAG: penicillin-binding protein 1A [Immundisolibacter sp.]|uniref:penicillin-binding protein 1A n=1 Tax=Immundisolibacter sp. TaxID=1934948 RepID=UPI003EDE83E0
MPLLRVLRALASAGINLAFAALLAGVIVYLALDRQLPAVEQLAHTQLAQPLQIYSKDRRTIAEFGDQRRIPLADDALPASLVQAILAAEDDRFFEHPGFDTRSILRAAWELIRTGKARQGGSTITQQVARNFFLSREKTFLRKGLEIMLAVRIEQHFSKDQILGLYVNKIFLGHRAYGFGAAAQIYYGRPIAQLTVSEIAMLAGLPKAPSRDNPLVNPKRALERRDYILGRMYSLGYLSADDYQHALEQADSAGHYGFDPDVDAPYVAEMARAWMVGRYGDAAYTDGYRVITTVDSQQQQVANRALRTGLLNYDRRHGFRGPAARIPAAVLADPTQLQKNLRALPATNELTPAVRLTTGDFWLATSQATVPAAEIARDTFARGWQPADGDVVYLRQSPSGWQLAQLPQVEGALVALYPDSGAITALVGGYDFGRSRFNRAVQAQRQPGSNFKPFIYAAALAAGYTAASVINDAPVAFPVDTPDGYWRPENYTGRFYGPTRLREALAQSRNLVSVRLMHAVGVGFTRRYCLRFGFDAARLPRNLSLALGTASVTPLELAAAYAVIANGGYRVSPYFIEQVLDRNDQIVWQAPRPVPCDAGCEMEQTTGGDTVPAPRVIPASDAYILNSMLSDAIDHGTAVRAKSLGRPDLAGKTGTTNEERDAWFTGFNRRLLATAWVGFDQPRSLGKGETGSRAALPVWMDFMASALADLPVSPMPVPSDLVSVRIDRYTGQPSSDSGPDTLFEWFSADRVPSAMRVPTPDPVTPTRNPETVLF